MTTLFGPSPTTGPSLLMLSFSCMPMPWKPVSDAPIESVKIEFGKAAIQRALTCGLKIAALLEIGEQVRALVAAPCASNASISGRAIASPVMKISWTPSRSMISQVRTGSNFGSSTVRCPANRCISRPGLGAAVHQRAEREGDHPRVGGLLGLVVLLERLTGVEVDAAAEHPPEVLVPPHHALGEAGGAAGVDDVEVVGAALAEVALGALARRARRPRAPRRTTTRRTGRRARARRARRRRPGASRAWACRRRPAGRRCARGSRRRRRRCRRGSRARPRRSGSSR